MPYTKERYPKPGMDNRLIGAANSAYPKPTPTPTVPAQNAVSPALQGANMAPIPQPPSEAKKMLAGAKNVQYPLPPMGLQQYANQQGVQINKPAAPQFAGQPMTPTRYPVQGVTGVAPGTYGTKTGAATTFEETAKNKEEADAQKAKWGAEAQGKAEGKTAYQDENGFYYNSKEEQQAYYDWCAENGMPADSDAAYHEWSKTHPVSHETTTDVEQGLPAPVLGSWAQHTKLVSDKSVPNATLKTPKPIVKPILDKFGNEVQNPSVDEIANMDEGYDAKWMSDQLDQGYAAIDAQYQLEIAQQQQAANLGGFGFSGAASTIGANVANKAALAKGALTVDLMTKHLEAVREDKYNKLQLRLQYASDQEKLEIQKEMLKLQQESQANGQYNNLISMGMNIIQQAYDESDAVMDSPGVYTDAISEFTEAYAYHPEWTYADAMMWITDYIDKAGW